MAICACQGLTCVCAGMWGGGHSSFLKDDIIELAGSLLSSYRATGKKHT